MKEINMVAKALHTKFDAHTLLKNTILNEINSLNADSLSSNDRGLLTYINRLDWEKSRDFKNRKWVNIIHGHLKNHFDKCARYFGYSHADIYQLWFQQYVKNDTHNWHIHSCSYTGVYYLEFPLGSPSTQIIDQHDNSFSIDAKEGDIIIFPSFFIHKSPFVLHDVRKTIISFNIDFYDVTKDMKSFEIQ